VHYSVHCLVPNSDVSDSRTAVEFPFRSEKLPKTQENPAFPTGKEVQNASWKRTKGLVLAQNFGCSLGRDQSFRLVTEAQRGSCTFQQSLKANHKGYPVSRPFEKGRTCMSKFIQLQLYNNFELRNVPPPLNLFCLSYRKTACRGLLKPVEHHCFVFSPIYGMHGPMGQARNADFHIPFQDLLLARAS
jgi:hypothetical protein